MELNYNIYCLLREGGHSAGQEFIFRKVPCKYMSLSVCVVLLDFFYFHTVQCLELNKIEISNNRKQLWKITTYLKLPSGPQNSHQIAPPNLSRVACVKKNYLIRVVPIFCQKGFSAWTSSPVSRVYFALILSDFSSACRKSANIKKRREVAEIARLNTTRRTDDRFCWSPNVVAVLYTLRNV